MMPKLTSIEIVIIHGMKQLTIIVSNVMRSETKQPLMRLPSEWALLNTWRTMLTVLLTDSSGRLLEYLGSSTASVPAGQAALNSWRMLPMIRRSSRGPGPGEETQIIRRRKRRKTAHLLTQAMTKRKRKRKKSKRQSSMVIRTTMDIKAINKLSNTWAPTDWTCRINSMEAVLHLWGSKITTMPCLSLKVRVWCSHSLNREERHQQEMRHSCLTMDRAIRSRWDKIRMVWCEWPKRRLSKSADPMAKWWRSGLNK